MHTSHYLLTLQVVVIEYITELIISHQTPPQFPLYELHWSRNELVFTFLRHFNRVQLYSLIFQFNILLLESICLTGLCNSSCFLTQSLFWHCKCIYSSVFYVFNNRECVFVDTHWILNVHYSSTLRPMLQLCSLAANSSLCSQVVTIFVSCLVLGR